VQFTARHIRGRPRPPHWSRGWPLYVCDSRYNDRERCFVRIKNWQSCVPEEVRGARARGEWMPVYPFERLVYPRRLSSPFVARNGVPRAKGPGGLGDPIERAEGERTEGGGTGRKRARKGAGGAGGGGPASLTDMYGPQKGPYAGGGPVPTPFVQPQPAATQHSHQHHPQQQTQQRHHTYSPQPAAQYQQQRIARIEDRSLLQAAGGAAVAASLAVETLPSETGEYLSGSPLL
jgi:chromatin structure-remodeling complex subunit RSC1/2